MTQYVYGKNVVRSLLEDNKKIYEILLADGMKDKEIETLIRQRNIKLRV